MTKKTRKIEVRVNNWNWFSNVMKALAAQPIYGINNNRAVAAILGSNDDADSQAMVKAYKKNNSFRIYVSYDLENFWFEDIQDKVTSNSAGMLKFV